MTRAFFLTCLVIPCISAMFLSEAYASNSTPLSYEQKKAAIESLKKFEAKYGSPSLFKEAPTKKVPEFTCDPDAQINCNQQRVLHKSKHWQPPVFVVNGKYKVDIFFTNDADFPHKYFEEDNFETISKEEEAGVIEQIFGHYLGSDFSSYDPKVTNVNDSTVGLTISLASSERLDVFLEDPRVIGIHHVGNNRVVQEGR